MGAEVGRLLLKTPVRSFANILKTTAKISRSFIRGRRSAPKIVPFRLFTAGSSGSDRIANHIRFTGNHMDSINQQQPEQNRADLSGAKAIEKMKQLVDKAETSSFAPTYINRVDRNPSYECAGSGRAR